MRKPATVPEHQARLPGQPNTLAVWDKRLTQQDAVGDYFPQLCKLHRITCTADRRSDRTPLVS